MKRILFTFLVVFYGSGLWAQKLKAADLKTGDLLFQNLDCGPMCEAIEAVTQGWHRMPFSHVGMIENTGNGLYVWESMGPGVRKVPLDSFRQRSSHFLLLGRVKKQYTKLVPAVVQFIHEQEGVGYDDRFLYNNGRYYCSELIYDAFKYANNNHPFFRLRPMTFKQPGSDEFFPVWVTYYRQLNMPVPEGKPGCNPGGLSRSGKIKIIGTF